MISYSIKHDFVVSAINSFCYYFQQVMGSLVLDLLKRKCLFPLKKTIQLDETRPHFWEVDLKYSKEEVWVGTPSRDNPAIRGLKEAVTVARLNQLNPLNQVSARVSR